LQNRIIKQLYLISRAQDVYIAIETTPMKIFLKVPSEYERLFQNACVNNMTQLNYVFQHYGSLHKVNSMPSKIMQIKARSLTQCDIHSLQNIHSMRQGRHDEEKRCKNNAVCGLHPSLSCSGTKKKRYTLLIEFVYGVYFNNDI
jgi:hypothetical protein